MSSKKSGGSSKNLRDSKPKYLGVKIADGQKAKVGSIILRQRGTKIIAGKNVKVARDHSLFALKDGIVKFSVCRKISFTNKLIKKKSVSII